MRLPPSTESKGAKILVDGSQELSSFWYTKRNGTDVEILHVVTAFQILMDDTFASRSESLNCIELSLFHFCGVTPLHNWNCLASMNVILIYGMPLQIPNCTDLNHKPSITDWR